MDVVSKTYVESMSGAYEAPTMNVVLLQTEGVLCASHGGFDYDNGEDL